MKHAKRIASVLLALVMAMALMVPALAAGFEPSDTVNVMFSSNIISFYAEGGEETQPEPCYNGYQLMTLVTSLKCTDTSSDHAHKKECYNYAYTLNPKYTSIMVKAANDPGVAIETASGDFVTADTLIEALELLDDKSETIQKFANAVYRAILDQKLDPEVFETKTFEETTITQGYWLFADVTKYNENDENTSYSLVLLETKRTTDDTIVVTPKTKLPTVDKTVKEPDYDLGEEIEFTLTGTMDEYVHYYETYTYIFHDTMSSGLTLKEGSFVVKLDGEVLGADNYRVDMSPADGHSFDVSIFNLNTNENVTADSKIVVTYKAVLNEDARQTDVETNEVYLEYSNNPYDEESTGKTPEKTVYVYDFDIVIDKYTLVEGDNDATTEKKLAGAKFVLYKIESGKKLYYYYDQSTQTVKWNPLFTDEEGNTETLEEVLAEGYTGTTKITEVITDENGAARFSGLDSDTYYLHETKAPDGYNQLKEDEEVRITATYDGEGKIVSSSATSTNGGQYEQTQKVKNSTGTQLPITGGIGTTIFYVLGSVLVVGAVVLLITKKRMSGEK